VAGARAVAEGALAGGITLRELYLGVFQWALYEVGRRWQGGEATVAQEHLATATTQTLMARLWRTAPTRSTRAGRAVVTATEDDFHVLGPRFLADFLEGEGWTVLDLGAATPTRDLVAMVRQTAPDLVCLSTTLPANLGGAADAVAALRHIDPRPLIAIGGQAYAGDESAARALGADLYANDAAAFLDALGTRRGPAQIAET
jgi:methanogenic corrinoid protein MtbC1